MFKITLSQRSDGMDVATLDTPGKTFHAASRHGVTRVIGRQVSADDIPDAPFEVRNDDGKLLYSGKSLHWHGCSTISETDAGFVIRPFVSPIGGFGG